MVHLMLHDAGMEAADCAIDWAAVLVVAAVAHSYVTRHETAHARDRQATFPTLFHRRVERIDDGIDQDRVRHLLSLGVPRIPAHAEDHDLPRDANLWRCEPRAVQRRHGVAHVLEQRVQLWRIERFDRLRLLQQPRIAHLQYCSNSHTSLIYSLQPQPTV